MRLCRAVPAAVYVALLSIAIAYGSPELYPNGERRGGGAQMRSSNVLATDIRYHFSLSGGGQIVSAAVGGKSLSCRDLRDGRWYCSGEVAAAEAESLRVTMH